MSASRRGRRGTPSGGGARTGAALQRILARAGVTRIVGRPFPGLIVTPCGDLDAAGVLAAAHDHLFGGRAALHLGAGRLLFGAGSLAAAGRSVEPAPGAAQPEHRITTLDELADVVVMGGSPAEPTLPDGAVVRIELEVVDGPADLSGAEAAPSRLDGVAAPGGGQVWSEPPGETLERLRAAARPVVLAGPQVVRAGQVAALHAVAASADVGVLNTFGAKGLFDWRSRHHFATVGLQERDLELGGLAGADLTLFLGVDRAELVGVSVPETERVSLDPASLGPLAERWRRAGRELALPPLRRALAAVTQEGWERTGGPLPPSAVTRAWSHQLGGRGLVVGEPGLAGYWLARTYPTSRLGEAVLPSAAGLGGFSMAASYLAAQAAPGRAVLAVADAPLRPRHDALVEAAGSAGLALVLEVLDPEGPTLDADAHAERLRRAFEGARREGRPVVLTLGTDHRQLARMVEVAGPVTAWSAPTDAGG